MRVTPLQNSIARLRDAAERLLESERPTFHGAASAQQIDAFETALGNRIPDDFRRLLQTCDAIVAMDVHNGYWIGGAEALAGGVARVDFPRMISDGSTSTPATPIASDGGGNTFLAKIADGSVWFLDHETGIVKPVASSIDGFLQRVAEDWLHFAADDHEWHYIV
jgi:SMI1 / KNR4 family (SUKH-1)